MEGSRGLGARLAAFGWVLRNLADGLGLVKGSVELGGRLKQRLGLRIVSAGLASVDGFLEGLDVL